LLTLATPDKQRKGNFRISNRGIFSVMKKSMLSCLGYSCYSTTSAWSNYFRPTCHFTKTWQLAGRFHKNDI